MTAVPPQLTSTGLGQLKELVLTNTRVSWSQVATCEPAEESERVMGVQMMLLEPCMKGLVVLKMGANNLSKMEPCCDPSAAPLLGSAEG